MLLQFLSRFFIALGLFVTVTLVQAEGHQPDIVIKKTYEKVISILGNSDLTEDTQRFQCQLIIQPLVDANAISKEVFANYWADMGSRDQLAASNSLRIIAFNEIWLELRQYTDENLQDFHFESAGSDSGSVHALMTSRDGKNTDLDFIMHTVNNEWQIKDLLIGGNSMTDSIQSRFMPVAQEKGVRGVLKTMKKEMREFKNVIKKLNQAEESDKQDY